MAWVEKLASGKYRGIYRDQAGKRRTLDSTFTHKARALAAAGGAETEARAAGWRSSDAAKQTWREWCDAWWPTRPVAQSTLLRDESRLRVHLMPRWGDMRLIDITEHDVRSWAVKLIREGRSPATAQRCVFLLSASLKAATKARVLVVNEAADVNVDRGRETRERYLTRDEVELIVDNMPSVRDQNVVYLLATTGMRWGEMAGLHWSRIDLERGEFTIAETLDDKNRLMIPWPKGKRSRRIKLAPWLLERLGEPTPKGATCQVPHVGGGKCPSGLVVATPKGTPVDAANWRRILDQAVEDAGLENVWPHLLRHSAASWAIQNGKSLADVGQLLGHRSPATTQRYAHLVDQASTALSDLPAPAPRISRSIAAP